MLKSVTDGLFHAKHGGRVLFDVCVCVSVSDLLLFLISNLGFLAFAQRVIQQFKLHSR